MYSVSSAGKCVTGVKRGKSQVVKSRDGLLGAVLPRPQASSDSVCYLRVVANPGLAKSISKPVSLTAESTNRKFTKSRRK